METVDRRAAAPRKLGLLLLHRLSPCRGGKTKALWPRLAGPPMKSQVQTSIKRLMAQIIAMNAMQICALLHVIGLGLSCKPF